MDLTLTIVFTLASAWSEVRTKEGLNRILRKYKTESEDPIPFQCIYIAEAEFGNASDGQIGSIIRAWWKVDNDGLTAIEGPQRDGDEELRFCRRPVWKFFTDGMSVAIGERIGPRLASRTVASVVTRDGKHLLEDFRLVWVSTS